MRDTLPYEIDGIVIKVNSMADAGPAWVLPAERRAGHRVQMPRAAA